MSIESVSARVEEIQARIRMLMPERPDIAAPLLSGAALPDLQTPERLAGDGTAAAQPFNVTFAKAMGQVTLRPSDSRLSPDIESLIEKHARLNNLDPDLVRAVIKVESDGNPRCVSPKGAMGLMQLMPADAEEYRVGDPFDPDQNIAGGVRQLADKLKTYHGDLRLALAAYNAGPGNVRKYGGVPPFPETQNYIRKIMGLMGR